ncbi:hypothetical protein HHL28_14290 [Aerophototrophica crusticola]|uniref:Uncharacterized protein n=1 Tax=Aerophototrophica crusticola TaxID=1709002 RepID=A0A858R9E9_9PROT|nr:hypothetical protein HHL28_14290 [Rhodospirillaceae bacterium B3]
MKFIRLEAIIHADRHATLAAAADAISAGGGWVTDHSLLSDVMAILNFQVPADSTGRLAAALLAAGIPAKPALPETMGNGAEDVSGQLTLTFPQGTGDLRRAVPAFDG